MGRDYTSLQYNLHFHSRHITIDVNIVCERLARHMQTVISIFVIFVYLLKYLHILSARLKTQAVHT